MPTKNTIRRDYLIIRRILQNDYPSKRTLLDYLKRYDTEIGERTFQRDLADIRSNRIRIDCYGIIYLFFDFRLIRVLSSRNKSSNHNT